MSISLLLILVAIAAPLVVFGDSLMQWSLRLLLDGGLDSPRRIKSEVPEAAAPAADAPASPAQAA